MRMSELQPTADKFSETDVYVLDWTVGPAAPPHGDIGSAYEVSERSYSLIQEAERWIKTHDCGHPSAEGIVRKLIAGIIDALEDRA